MNKIKTNENRSRNSEHIYTNININPYSQETNGMRKKFTKIETQKKCLYQLIAKKFQTNKPKIKKLKTYMKTK